MLCFVVVMQSCIMNSHEVFIHIHQGCFAGTGAIVRLPQCQWSKPDGYGKISQCITTTKHSKAKTVCIFLGIYCMIPSVLISRSHNKIPIQLLIAFEFSKLYRLVEWPAGFWNCAQPETCVNRRFYQNEYIYIYKQHKSHTLIFSILHITPNGAYFNSRSYKSNGFNTSIHMDCLIST